MINELKDIIYFHRKQAGLSRRELAMYADVSETVIYYLEKGKMTLQFDTILAILKALNISINFSSPLMTHYEESKSTDA